MCGATEQQTQIEQQQQDFYGEMTREAKATFGDKTAITGALTQAFMPYLKAGPNQKGFSDEEETALNTQATEGIAAAYKQASEALGEKIGAQGGGDAFLPSGATTEIQADTVRAGAAQLAEDRNQIKQASFSQGRQNWLTAAQALSGNASLLDSTGVANAATSSGAAAANTANDIAKANNSIWGAALGALGGVAGAAAGGLGYTKAGGWSFGGNS